MSRRIMIRALCFVAAAIIMLAAASLESLRKSRKYKQAITDNYTYAFSELLTGVSKMDYALKKSVYAESDAMLTSLCTEIFRESAASAAALSQLPVSELHLDNTAKFLSQAGDYAYAVSKRTARGAELTDEEREQIAKLSETATQISKSLTGIAQRIENDSLSLADMNSEAAKASGGIASDMSNLEQEFSEYPVLIYDGPFSEHIKDRSAAFTESLPEIDENTARKSAALLLGIQENLLESDGARLDGKLEIYSFKSGEGKKAVVADVTKHGGIVLRTIGARTAESTVLTAEEAIEKCVGRLSESGFSNMKSTYYMRYGNTLTVNFAAFESGTILYPDLVKVTIALDDGEIINFDATGYVMNHRERNIRDISVGRAAAEAKISDALTVIAYAPAVIPTDGENELLAHEFKCEDAAGNHCIVYINPDSYIEERILILIEDENGTLTM